MGIPFPQEIHRVDVWFFERPVMRYKLAKERFKIYNEKNGSEVGKIEVAANGEIIVAVCDAFCRRVHKHVPQAGDIVLMDATSNLDRHDTKLFHLICPSAVRGFHLLQAFWRWLWSADHKISKIDCPQLYNLFRALVFVQTDSDHDEKKRSSEKVQKSGRSFIEECVSQESRMVTCLSVSK